MVKKFGKGGIIALSLHHFPLKNRGQNNGESRKAKPDKKKEIVLYSNIIEQRSLKYLSS